MFKGKVAVEDTCCFADPKPSINIDNEIKWRKREKRNEKIAKKRQRTLNSLMKQIEDSVLDGSPNHALILSEIYKNVFQSGY